MDTFYTVEFPGPYGVVNIYNPVDYSVEATHTIAATASVYWAGGVWLLSTTLGGVEHISLGTSLDNMAEVLVLGAGEYVYTFTEVGGTYVLEMGSGSLMKTTNLTSFTTVTPSPIRTDLVAVGLVWKGVNYSTGLYEYSTNLTSWTVWPTPSGYARIVPYISDTRVAFFGGYWYELLKRSSDSQGIYLARYASLGSAPTITELLAPPTTYDASFIGVSGGEVYAVLNSTGEGAGGPLYWLHGVNLGQQELLSSDSVLGGVALFGDRLYINATLDYTRGGLTQTGFPAAYSAITAEKYTCTAEVFVAWWTNKSGVLEA